ncbi:nitrate reductase cytochrome c-type subunit [Glaesserella sp.]|uniref:nitrate reductase cytochrome c-type subunit n=1 Tax=Glaesserella sp. TaxID=2094731 RepID=UPI00359FF88E
MKKYLALFLTVIAAFAVAETPTTQIGSSLEHAAENVAPEFTNPLKDSDSIPITFVYQPPLVPHSIRGLQVTKNVNQCLNCHGIEISKVTGAPRAPKSHFMTQDGKMLESESPRRYFCLQCHVQQADVNPIIQNKFDTISQSQGN